MTKLLKHVLIFTIFVKLLNIGYSFLQNVASKSNTRLLLATAIYQIKNGYIIEMIIMSVLLIILIIVVLCKLSKDVNEKTS